MSWVFRFEEGEKKKQVERDIKSSFLFCLWGISKTISEKAGCSYHTLISIQIP